MPLNRDAPETAGSNRCGRKFSGRLIHTVFGPIVSDMIFIFFNNCKSALWGLLAAAAMLFSGCAHHQPLPPEPNHWVYRVETATDETAGRWAPAFVAYDHGRDYNRIGRPTVGRTPQGKERVFVDSQEPVAYFMKRTFATDKAAYTNLIYRVHFPKVPFSLIPFNLTAGNNVGLIVVVTLNSENLPVLVTTVHTCGCYKAMVPTQYLPRDAFPENWSGETLDIYGERLPPLLNFESLESPRILVYLRPEVHRVMDLEIRDQQDLAAEPFRIIPMRMASMDRLEKLPAEGGTSSFYYSEGVLKGHVKGSVKPLEMLFLSLISLDLFVGTDKAYADSAETGNPFYTSLKPWRRRDSNMWDFANFLHYWGWRL